MDINQAIATLEDLGTTLPQRSPCDRRKAVLIAIEALIFIRLSRVSTPGSVPTLLYGETPSSAPFANPIPIDNPD